MSLQAMIVAAVAMLIRLCNCDAISQASSFGDGVEQLFTSYPIFVVSALGGAMLLLAVLWVLRK